VGIAAASVGASAVWIEAAAKPVFEGIMRRPLAPMYGYYWRSGEVVQNLGDTLAAFFARYFGYRLLTDQPPWNPFTPSSLLVGSIITRGRILRQSLGYRPVEVWGCGSRGVGIGRVARALARFRAVRGPLTREILGLPETVPLGDPGLLCARIFARPAIEHDRAILIPHFLREADAAVAARAAGCSDVISMGVALDTADRDYLDLPRAEHDAASDLGGVISTVAQIASAGFVLSSSLHGAIIAQAYGRPWAIYDNGALDLPFKWRDYGASLGVEIRPVSTLAEGMAWYRSNASVLTSSPIDLDRLEEAFPTDYGCRSTVSALAQ
jgi:hypothetical protein